MYQKFSLVLILSFLLQVVALPSALAANESLNLAGKKTAIVAKAAAFGLGGGLVVGLASQVVKRKTNNIFLAGSLGMYVGIAMGIYIVTAPKGGTPYDGPDTYEDYGNYQSGKLLLPEVESKKLADAKSKAAEVSFVNVNF